MARCRVTACLALVTAKNAMRCGSRSPLRAISNTAMRMAPRTSERTETGVQPLAIPHASSNALPRTLMLLADTMSQLLVLVAMQPVVNARGKGAVKQGRSSIYSKSNGGLVHVVRLHSRQFSASCTSNRCRSPAVTSVSGVKADMGRLCQQVCLRPKLTHRLAISAIRPQKRRASRAPFGAAAKKMDA